jgi:DNA-directed RNA polymerase subunit RPC12/RpoP
VRVVIAIVIGLAIAGVGWSMIRGLTTPAPRSASPDEARPMLHVARITYWCENCGTEVLLLRQGSDAPPKHCGEKMLKREEVTRP